MSAIEIGSDVYLKWSGLYDNLNDAYVNDATVTVSLQDLDETEIYSGSLSYESGSNGNYEGTIPAATTATLTNCTEYLIELTATKSGATTVKRERRLAIDLNSCWLRFNHPYLNELSLTDQQAGLVSVMILAAQETIEKELGRTILETEHDEIARVQNDGAIVLKHFPLTTIARIQAEKKRIINIQNTTAQSASYSTTTTAVKLTRYVSGTRTNNTLTYSDNATITAMADAITAVGNGWTASVADSDYASYPSVDLVAGQHGTAGSQNNLWMWDASNERHITANNRTGVIESGFSRNADVRLVYSAGFSDAPEPLKKVAADMVVSHWNGNAGAVQAEKIGDYSYSLASMNDQLRRLPVDSKRIISHYKDRRV